MKEHWIVYDDVVIHCASAESAKECAQNRAKAKPGRTSYVAFVTGNVVVVPLPEPGPEPAQLANTTH